MKISRFFSCADKPCMSDPRQFALSSVIAIGLLLVAVDAVSQTYDGPRTFSTYPARHGSNVGVPSRTGPSGQTSGSSSEPSQTIIYSPVYFPSMCGPGSMGSSGGAAEARAAYLDKEGPQVPRIFSMSSFSVMGFVKGTWPVVFDYQLEKDSLLIVVISPEGQTPILYRLNGKAGHWQSRLTVPASVGSNSVVAQYLLQSIDDNVGPVGPAHLHVHGIAAGPRAVGSIGIDQVSFGPDMIHMKMHEKAQYAFHSISDFKNVEVNFVRIANNNGEIIAARVGKKGEGSIAKNEQKGGDWDGKIDPAGKDFDSFPPKVQQWLKSSGGQHLLQVRAWYGAKDGDWATALSENFVTVE